MNVSFPVSSRIIAWAWVVAWMAVIFVLSSISDLRSGFQPLWDTIFRKIAHGVEYAVLGWLTFRAFERTGLRRGGAAVSALILSALYAASDEIHQQFVPGRQAAVVDGLIDTFGALVGILVRQWRMTKKS